MQVELIAITKYLREDGTAEELLEHAGRVCYRTRSKGDPGKFIQKRVREGHESIIEHASLTFDISGISRACSHQLVRHRIASYSQESQRYVDLSDPEFVVPPSVADVPAAMEVWDELVGQMKEAYRELRRLGTRKEDARFLLPNATATRIVVTMNLRELRHFFKVRCDRAAQWEIRALATEMLKLAYQVAPAVFEDLHQEFMVEEAADG
jgi:thymidylate synthase (FAD)